MQVFPVSLVQSESTLDERYLYHFEKNVVVKINKPYEELSFEKMSTIFLITIFKTWLKHKISI